MYRVLRFAEPVIIGEESANVSNMATMLSLTALQTAENATVPKAVGEETAAEYRRARAALIGSCGVH